MKAIGRFASNYVIYDDVNTLISLINVGVPITIGFGKNYLKLIKEGSLTNRVEGLEFLQRYI